MSEYFEHDQVFTSHISEIEECNNYFTSLRQWIAIAKEKEQNYVQDYIARFVPPAANRINVEVIDHGPHTQGFYEYVLPPIWKRFAAEVIDFIILLIIKLYLSFIFLSTFHVELSSYEINNYLDNPKLTLEISTELAVLEIAFRIVVCLYETYWLQGGNSATPGKTYMGLKVYYVTHLTVVRDHPQLIVRAHPCTPLGWQNAIVRAILKNIFVGLLMFPVCFGFLFFNQHRTGYDILTKSLVVEHNENPPQQEAM